MLVIVAASVGYYFIKENERKTPQTIDYKTVETKRTDLSVYVSAEGHIVKKVNE